MQSRRLGHAFRFASVLALAPGMMVATGCGSFGEASGESDAGPAIEAGRSDAGGREDGGLPSAEAGASYSFQEDFETDAWAARWKPTGAGSLAVTSGPSVSGTHSLDLTLLDGSQTALTLTLPAGAVRKVVATVKVLVVERGDGEIDFVQLMSGQAASPKGVFFVHSQARGTFVSEASDNNPGQVIDTEEQSFAAYTLVSIALDLRSHAYVVTVGAAQTKGVLDATWKPTQLFFKIGAPFASGVTKAWRVRFDDVSVTTEP